MTKEYIDLNPNKNYAFSTCVKAGDFIYLAHHGGIIDEKGNVLENIEEQTGQTFKNIEKTLKAAGASFNDVIKTNVYLKNIKDFQKMNEVYRRYFNEGYPARMTSTTAFVDEKCLIQIDLVAYKSS
ncbi:MAG: RidA family protein [Promethearchaeota archaeon]